MGRWRWFGRLSVLLAVLSLGAPLIAQDTSPVAIKLGIYVIGLSEFDLSAGIYEADFYLTMQCSRPCTDDETSIDVIGVSGAEGLSIETRVSREDYREYRIQAKLAQNRIDLTRFPFDNHQLQIMIESRLLTTDQVRYEQLEGVNGVDQDVQVLGWGLRPTYEVEIIDKNYYDDATQDYARYIFRMNLNRVTSAAIIRDILPALVILLINFLGAFIPDRNNRIGLVGGVLLAMLVHHLTVADGLPAVGYPIYFDAFMLVNHAAILFQFALTVYELYLEKRMDDAVVDKISLRLLGIGFVVWAIFQIVVWFVFQNLRFFG
jgi:hypothetical protein